MTTGKNHLLPQRVLIAEDEHLIAAGIAAGVRHFGLAVVGPFNDGAAALEAAAKDPPDLALLDIRMAGLDGLATAKTLWDEYVVPSVLVTAFSDEAYLSQAQDTGVFGYLLKPVSTEGLRAAIAVAWSRAGSADIQAKRIAQLEHSLVNRRVVEQAKWKLVEKHAMSEADAHAKLQQQARDQRRKLVDVANEVIAGTLIIT